MKAEYDLKEKWNLNHVPERILVEWLLTENDKTFHIRGKLYKNQKKSELYLKAIRLHDSYF